jgi:hypothetical protein
MLFATLYCFMPTKAEAQIYVCNYGYVYGLSYILDDPLTNTVYGYSATELDFCAGLYYDPYVEGYMFKGSSIVSARASLGYANIVDAVVTTSAVRSPLIKYSQLGDHYVRAVVYDGPGYGFRDPFGFSYFTGGIYDGSGSFYGGYGFTYYFYQYIYIGRTLVQITPLPICTLAPSNPTDGSFIYGDIDSANPPAEAACPTPTPTPTPSYTLALEVDSPVLTTGLSSAVPGRRTTEVRAFTAPASNVPVTLSIEGVRNSGGHMDTYHRGTRPAGSLVATKGRTDKNGLFRTRYNPSHIAGYVKITAKAGNQTRDVQLQVGIPGLQELGAGTNYALIGFQGNNAHPEHTNHWGTQAANTGLVQIADDYKNEYYSNVAIPDQNKLRYNDQGLPFGGKFDLGRGWLGSGAHAEHREGINCDVRCCSNPGAVPHDRWARLNEIFRNRGSTRTNDETDTAAPHWHLRFEFNRPRNNPTTSVESFVEAATSGALSRVTSDSEGQNWSERLTKSQAQGPDQLLLEAKLLVRTLVQSGEYYGLNKSDDQYITTLYETYFMREPTADEAAAHLQTLQSNNALGANGREIMLQEFENAQEFSDLVGTLASTRGLWTDLVGVAINSSNGLMKTSTTAGWNAGAISTQSLSGDGYVEFSTDELNTGKICGLSNGSGGQNYPEIDYAISLGAANNLRIYENGVQITGSFGTYLPGEKYRVAVEGGVVKYYKNGSLLYTSTVAPTYPLLVDTSLSTTNATISKVSIVAMPTITWTNPVGVMVNSSNGLTKTGTTAGWNAGATSIQTLSGDGYVEFSTGELSTGKACGLSNSSGSQNYPEIDYVIMLGAANNVRIYENGVQITGSFGTYAPGDRYRVAIESGVVKYYKNGTLLYTSTVAPTYPLLVDTSLYTTDATITDTVISGDWSETVYGQ